MSMCIGIIMGTGKLKNSPLPSSVQSILKVLLVQPLLYVVKQGVAGSGQGCCLAAVWLVALSLSKRTIMAIRESV